MTTYVTLQEAAGYLGVSKATLRNWDKAGKLKATRDPINQYRVYALSDLQEIQARLPLEEDKTPKTNEPKSLTPREIRSLINRLHNILRDNDSHSNIIERFDELTKILFLKLQSEETDQDLFHKGREESAHDFADRLRAAYLSIARDDAKVPSQFKELNAADVAVCECASALDQISFRKVSFDVKGLAYEEVIKNTFDKSDNQQFFTPPQIVKFMVEMLRPELQGAICDPAAGTGGFLVEILKGKVPHSSLTAFEIDERLAWVAGINLATHGASQFATHWLQNGGTLGKEAREFFGKYDSIITNPPFGSDLTDANLLHSFQLGTGRSSRRRGILFLERCHQLLRKGGILAFIIDEGVLNGNSAEDVRRFITENFEIQAIVSLPETAFMPYASVNASILFLRKPKTKGIPPHQTFFGKAEKIGRKSNGDDDLVYEADGKARLNSDLPEILDLFRRHNMGGTFDASELAYTAEVEKNLSEDPRGWRLDFRFHHPTRKESQRLLDSSERTLVSLADLCEERNETVVPSKELEGQVILYTGLANIEADVGIAHQVPTPANSLKSAVKRFEPGDILFAKMRPGLRKVALMNGEEGGYASPECVVFTVRTKATEQSSIDPLLLSVLLRSDLVHGQIMHLIAGIGRPRLSAKDLRQVRIPVPPEELQRTWRARYLAEIEASARLRDKAEALLRDAAEMERNAVHNLAQEFV
jgi:excisionase family DNA binding protein